MTSRRYPKSVKLKAETEKALRLATATYLEKTADETTRPGDDTIIREALLYYHNKRGR